MAAAQDREREGKRGKERELCMIYELCHFCLLLLLLFIGFTLSGILSLSTWQSFLLFHFLLSFFLSQQDVEDPRTESLREYCYGLMLPIICSLGIIGNVLNLIVLTRRNMRGTAYIYMRGKSASPFSIHSNSNFNSIDCLH